MELGKEIVSKRVQMQRNSQATSIASIFPFQAISTSISQSACHVRKAPCSVPRILRGQRSCRASHRSIETKKNAAPPQFVSRKSSINLLDILLLLSVIFGNKVIPIEIRIVYFSGEIPLDCW